MPIISAVGRRSLKLRILIGSIYALLILGSITTAYPFLVMVSGSLSTNDTDTSHDFRIVPRYFYSERALFEAYLWHKCHRRGITDLEHQWKILVQAPQDMTSSFNMVPGLLPKPDRPFVQPLIFSLCDARFEQFKSDYEAAGAPGTWNKEFEAVVEKHYRFAVQDVEKLLNNSPSFKLQRHILLATVRESLKNRIGQFVQDYVGAGEPDPRSPAFDTLAANYPFLTTSSQFVSVIRDYYLHKKPNLGDRRIHCRVADFLEFRQTLPMSHRESFWTSDWSTFEANKLYRRWLRNRYGSLAKLNEAYGSAHETWVRVQGPINNVLSRGFYAEDTPLLRDWCLWIKQLDPEYIRAPGMEYEWSIFLKDRYQRDISRLNKVYGSDYLTFMDVPLLERAPAKDTEHRADWEAFVRERLPLIFMRFEGGHDQWRAFLEKRFGSLDELNEQLKRSYSRWTEVELPFTDEPIVFQEGDALRHLSYPPTKLENKLLLEFVQTQMPTEDIRVVTGENLYRKWLLGKYGNVGVINNAYGSSEKTIDGFYYPTSLTDWVDFSKNKSQTFWFTLTRAYGTAIDHIFRWRRSLWNTAVFCGAVVALALIVNPMCAYALSRFNLPGSYKILLFLMATMAFPAEITLIPNFLILKSFPLLRIITAVVGVFIGAGICTLFVRSQRILYPILGAVVGGVLGATILAEATSGVTGLSKEIPLLNTYWALILPGVASGFSIFILKGFFDSLPEELYDSAVVDGASELRIFTQITMPMAKPVLAVIALWAFTAAYGSFTWALIICQDPKMWTLMVHLYQYQMYVDPCEILAGLTLASLPTLFVFIIAQKVILKGIVFPTFK